MSKVLWIVAFLCSLSVILVDGHPLIHNPGQSKVEEGEFPWFVSRKRKNLSYTLRGTLDSVRLRQEIFFEIESLTGSRF